MFHARRLASSPRRPPASSTCAPAARAAPTASRTWRSVRYRSVRYRKGRWTSRAVLVRGGEAGSLSASTGCSRIWTIRLESEAVVCALSAVTRVNRACASALVPNLEIFFRTSHEQSSWCSRLSSGGRSCFFKAPGREWCWDSQPCAEVAVILIDGSRLPRGWGRQARSHPCAGGDGGKTAVDFYQCCEVIYFSAVLCDFSPAMSQKMAAIAAIDGCNALSLHFSQ